MFEGINVVAWEPTTFACVSGIINKCGDACFLEFFWYTRRKVDNNTIILLTLNLVTFFQSREHNIPQA